MFSKKMAQTALRMLNKYGNTITLKQPLSTDYNPSTGKDESIYQTYTIKGLLEDDKLKSYQTDKVEFGDILLLISSELPIQRDWSVNYDDDDWNILDIKKVSAEDNIIISYLHLRT